MGRDDLSQQLILLSYQLAEVERERDDALRQLSATAERVNRAEAAARSAQLAERRMRRSLSWRITAPVRTADRVTRKALGK
ncbi:MAG: hypothetical protein FWG11_02600 [Promicromonosporaceae bacterium]|nr:hypothetical protein [Promicromonosporaceae bacterium]